MRMIHKQDLEPLIERCLNRNEIAEVLGFNPITVGRALKRNNLKTKKGSGGQNRLFTHNPFEDIEDPTVQYWLGFMAADGNLSSKKYAITLSQANKDIYHVELFRQFVSDKLTIHKRINAAGSEVWAVTWGSMDTHKFLTDIGLTPKKSLTLEYLSHFTRDFVRGVFDGDGCCSTNKQPKITTGSERFRDQLVEFFTQNNIKCSWREKGDKRAKNPCYDVYTNDKQKFYELLYNDASLYLSRKKINVENAL
jgi:hypothetical protein